MSNLVGRTKNQNIQDSLLMKPKRKDETAKKTLPSRLNTYLENAATDESRQSHEVTSRNSSEVESESKRVGEPHQRISKTKDLIRKHMFYSERQLDRTGRIAEVLMQKKSRARNEGSPKVKTSEIITRNTFIRASLDAVLSLFDDDDIEMVDNEEELRDVVAGRIRKAR